MRLRPDSHTLSVRDTANGIAVRATLLSVVALLAGTWLFTLAARLASGLVRGIAAVLLLAAGGGWVGWQGKKLRERFRPSTRPRVQPAEAGDSATARRISSSAIDLPPLHG